MRVLIMFRACEPSLGHVPPRGPFLCTTRGCCHSPAFVGVTTKRFRKVHGFSSPLERTSFGLSSFQSIFLSRRGMRSRHVSMRRNYYRLVADREMSLRPWNAGGPSPSGQIRSSTALRRTDAADHCDLVIVIYRRASKREWSPLKHDPRSASQYFHIP